MGFYRIVNYEEIKNTIENGFWKSNNRIQGPYEAGTVIFVFEFNSPKNMTKRYGATIASLRDETGKIYVLEFDFDKKEIENDKSQCGWSETRVYHGSIALDKIRCIGYCNVTNSNSGNYEVSELIFYDKPKKIEELYE
ncbi:MAG: hypothetical protein KAW92_00625 [Candidatus Cloacimonetes bacterium]|nr:hypothetical protein [Candidatus Cloacimonadota bacterium]